MNMPREYLTRTPKRLFDLTLDVLVHNLIKLTCQELEYLNTLPKHIKNLLLKKYLNSKYIFRANFPGIFSTLVNNNTFWLELPCHISNEEIAILRKCTHLRELIMSKNSKITSTVLINSLQELHFLKAIVLPCCQEINDNVIKCLVDNCPDLETVDLVSCQGITNDSMLHLAKCEKLLHLALSKTQIGDNGIIAVVRGSSGKTLVELRINNCPNITENGMNAIIENCQKIQILHMGCNNIGDAPEFFDAVSSKNLKLLVWTM